MEIWYPHSLKAFSITFFLSACLCSQFAQDLNAVIYQKDEKQQNKKKFVLCNIPGGLFGVGEMKMV